MPKLKYKLPKAPQICVRIEQPIYVLFEKYCIEHNCTRSICIERALERLLTDNK